MPDLQYTYIYFHICGATMKVTYICILYTVMDINLTQLYNCLITIIMHLEHTFAKIEIVQNILKKNISKFFFCIFIKTSFI